MSWPCRLVNGPTEDGPNEKMQPGDMWFTPQMVEKGFRDGYVLSDEYKRDWQDKRSPIWVVLPSGDWFCVDSRASCGDGSGWAVTGEAPNITVSPSINLIGIYHGFLQNGVLSDDCEGRTYP
jgi:hypothetical protein